MSDLRLAVQQCVKVRLGCDLSRVVTCKALMGGIWASE